MGRMRMQILLYGRIELTCPQPPTHACSFGRSSVVLPGPDPAVEAESERRVSRNGAREKVVVEDLLPLQDCEVYCGWNAHQIHNPTRTFRFADGSAGLRC